jgi:predicted small secreted protein
MIRLREARQETLRAVRSCPPTSAYTLRHEDNLGRFTHMKRIHKIVLWCLLLVSCLSLFGCHTVRGVGQDIESAGRAISHVGE